MLGESRPHYAARACAAPEAVRRGRCRFGRALARVLLDESAHWKRRIFDAGLIRPMTVPSIYPIQEAQDPRAAQARSGRLGAGSLPLAQPDLFRQQLDRARRAPNSPDLQGKQVVQPGQTLTSLTRQYLGADAQGMSAGQIHQLALGVGQANALRDPDKIRVGQVLDFSSLQRLRPLARQVPASDPQPLPRVAAEPAPAPLAAAGGRPRVAIVGDSIAVGIGGSVLRSQGVPPQFFPGRKGLVQNELGYAIEATGGHSSPQTLRRIQQNPGLKNADLAIISIGTNDIVNQPVNAYYSPQQITQNLKNIRAGLGAEKNLWVLPYDPQARALVLNVAQQFGDQTLDLADFKKADRYHPLKYGDIANALRPSIAQALDAAMQKAAKQTPPLSAPWASTSAVLSNRPSSF